MIIATLPKPRNVMEKYVKGFIPKEGVKKMMDPLALSSLISGGTSLLSGLLSGIQKGKAAKELKSATRPVTPYYETFRMLPALQMLYQNSLLGVMRDLLGEDIFERWGINNNVLNMLRGLPTYNTISPYERLLSKYTNTTK